jgi:hypothetical protein
MALPARFSSFFFLRYLFSKDFPKFEKKGWKKKTSTV